MKHTKQEVLKAKRVAIAEIVIKNCIKQDKIKEAVHYCEINKISSERFGELTKEVVQCQQ